MKRFMNVLVMVFVCATAYALTSFFFPLHNEAWAQDPFAEDEPTPPLPEATKKPVKKPAGKVKRQQRHRGGGPPKNNDEEPTVCQTTGEPPPEGGQCPTVKELIAAAQEGFKKKAEADAFTKVIITIVICTFLVLMAAGFAIGLWLKTREWRGKMDKFVETVTDKLPTLANRVTELERSVHPRSR